MNSRTNMPEMICCKSHQLPFETKSRSKSRTWVFEVHGDMTTWPMMEKSCFLRMYALACELCVRVYRIWMDARLLTKMNFIAFDAAAACRLECALAGTIFGGYCQWSALNLVGTTCPPLLGRGVAWAEQAEAILPFVWYYYNLICHHHISAQSMGNGKQSN